MFQIAEYLRPEYIAVAGTFAGLTLIVTGMVSSKKYYKSIAVIVLLLTYALMHIASKHHWAENTSLLNKYDASMFLLLLGAFITAIALISNALFKRYALRFTVLAMLPILMSFNFQAFVLDQLISDLNQSGRFVILESELLKIFLKV